MSAMRYYVDAEDRERCPTRSFAPSHYRPDGTCKHIASTPELAAVISGEALQDVWYDDVWGVAA